MTPRPHRILSGGVVHFVEAAFIVFLVLLVLLVLVLYWPSTWLRRVTTTTSTTEDPAYDLVRTTEEDV